MLQKLPGFEDLVTASTPRRELDYYPSRQLKAVRAAIQSVFPPDFEPRSILDPAAGDGIWAFCFRERWPNAFIVALDIDPRHQPQHFVDIWKTADYLTADVWQYRKNGFDLIGTNPPYAIQEPNKKKPTPCVERFIRKGYTELAPGGWLSFLLTQGFVGTVDRVAGLFREIPIYSQKIYDKRLSFFDAVDAETGQIKKNSTDNYNYVQLSFKQGFVPQLDHCGVPLQAESGFIQWGSK